MFVKLFLASSNPFFDSYVQSDFLGKLIFLGLVILSICSWVLIIHKVWTTYQARQFSQQFLRVFHKQRLKPLGINCESFKKGQNPFLHLYLTLKKQTVDILNKNRRFGQKEGEEGTPYLSSSDVDHVESHLISTIAFQTKSLEKNLFILATIVSLAPFLGLLGTVWGIMSTFSALQAQGGGIANQAVLGGMSMALATTVLGLLDAIPALIGYNYLKNSVRDFGTEMEHFSTELLSSVEMQYRKVDFT